MHPPEVGESGEDHDEESPERRDRTWHFIIARVREAMCERSKIYLISITRIGDNW